MAENAKQNEKTPMAKRFSKWFAGLKAEFRKIIWLDQQTVVRQTTAVVAVTVVTGLFIALLDWVIQYGVNFLVGLSI